MLAIKKALCRWLAPRSGSIVIYPGNTYPVLETIRKVNFHADCIQFINHSGSTTTMQYRLRPLMKIMVLYKPPLKIK